MPIELARLARPDRVADDVDRARAHLRRLFAQPLLDILDRRRRVDRDVEQDLAEALVPLRRLGGQHLHRAQARPEESAARRRTACSSLRRRRTTPARRRAPPATARSIHRPIGCYSDRGRSPMGPKANGACCSAGRKLAGKETHASHPQAARHPADAARRRHGGRHAGPDQGNGRITLGYGAEARPFSFQDSGGKPIGYGVELCARVAEALKAELASCR